MPKKPQADPIRLVICGGSGRMGGLIASLAERDGRFELEALIDRRPPSASLRMIFSPNEFESRLHDCDVTVDFSAPEASTFFAGRAAANRKPIVIGTTGFSAKQLAAMRGFSKRTAIFLSPNFSLAMNVLFELACRAAAALPEYDAGIVETHHTQKKDKPSGTALRLAEAVQLASARKGVKRAVSIQSQRLGTVIGDHTLTLAGPMERLELTHRAESREAFARGALDAAEWLAGRRPGLYDMRDLLNLSKL